MVAQLTPAIIEALAIGNLPDVRWKDHDDQCDCTFQRICQWTNPFLGTTHEERLCCIWAKLHEMFPGYQRDIPAYFDFNKDDWVTEPQEWDGETEMPKAIWYRHLAHKYGRPLSDIRGEFSEKDELRPKGREVREPIPFVFVFGGQEVVLDLARVRFRA